VAVEDPKDCELTALGTRGRLGYDPPRITAVKEVRHLTTSIAISFE
jgi:hypothetical protein